MSDDATMDRPVAVPTSTPETRARRWWQLGATASLRRRQGTIDKANARVLPLVAIYIVFLIVLWPVVILAMSDAWVAVPTVVGQIGVGTATAISWLFGAIVLYLFVEPSGQARRRWVASGFLLLGLGGLVFGWLRPMLGIAVDHETLMYESLVIRSLSGIALAFGLVATNPPACTRRMALALVGAGAVAAGAIVFLGDDLPALLQLHLAVADGPVGGALAEPDLEAVAERGASLLPALTPVYWGLSAVPLGAAAAAALGAVRASAHEGMSRWLALAMVVYAGSQLHDLLWPSSYTLVLTTADVLRLVVAVIVVVGGALELRRVAQERGALLEVEREHARVLQDLAQTKADFTAMAAHELKSPILTIRTYAELLKGDIPDPRLVRRAVDAIEHEARLIDGLVSEVQASALDDREELSVAVSEVRLGDIVADALAYLESVTGQPRAHEGMADTVIVRADRARVGQVLRNLILNAVRYGGASTPVELQIAVEPRLARVAVVDQGPGIDPDDLPRIFDKFRRGRAGTASEAKGLGLGLYVSQRIMQAHGSAIEVESQPGAGATFTITLERV